MQRLNLTEGGRDDERISAQVANLWSRPCARIEEKV